jgi:hypothetical protein
MPDEEKIEEAFETIEETEEPEEELIDDGEIL